MPAAVPELERRRVATEKTLAKFRESAFDWRKRRTCAHLAKYQARMMGRKLPSVPDFRSPLGAKRALTGMGHDSMIALLDSHLERIAPAMMRLGDLAAVQGTEGMDSVMVSAGNGKLFGWREDAEQMVMLAVTLDEIDAAWRL
ncbi:DUF6950 family protein [Novosphingopyxis sp. YJ-S2-01]|uniref:DUF6950 family protein n=1 Tax=Novosphingopyxis sp. YJ-S2-01 TaxID=2794021 RepID=UPI0018DE2200|nr:hypothetical protein [Novosphingopyxis sp. YJ-S2-01]MBH9537533.1 hypothetical protein [Novosphingopyxis sp. YJ-S2-01]